MKKLMQLLQKAGGLKLDLREHRTRRIILAARERAKQADDTELLNILGGAHTSFHTGKWQLLVSSRRGAISVLTVAVGGIVSIAGWDYEIYCISDNKLFEDSERYYCREKVAVRVHSLLASPTMQIVDTWRARNGS